MGSRDFDKSGFGGGGNQLAQYITNRALLSRGQAIQQQFNQNPLDPSQAPPFLHPDETNDWWHKPAYNSNLGAHYWETMPKEVLPAEHQKRLEDMRTTAIQVKNSISQVLNDPDLQGEMNPLNPRAHSGWGALLNQFAAQSNDPEIKRKAQKLTSFLSGANQTYRQMVVQYEGVRGAIGGGPLVTPVLGSGYSENPESYVSKAINFLNNYRDTMKGNADIWGNVAPGKYATGFLKKGGDVTLGIDGLDDLKKEAIDKGYYSPFQTPSTQAPSPSGLGGIFPSAQGQGQAPSPQASPSPQGGDEKAQFLARMLARNSPR